MTKSKAGSDPVFLHSSFRTSSTWLWLAFRRVPEVLAYYEFFSEALNTLTPQAAISVDASVWRSRHPQSSPYFMEYLPLLNPEGGCAKYEKDFSFNSFIPLGGFNSSLTSSEHGYVKSLIDNAHQQTLIPVLSCTRSLGRISALKRAFSGYHICLRRNLLHQWNSYSGQKRTGNAYFINSLFEIIYANRHDKFMQTLAGFVELRRSKAHEGPNVSLSHDDTFVVFTAFHLYFDLLSTRSVDQVIDVSSLADSRYRTECTGLIRDQTGIVVEFSDADETVDYPEALISDVESARLQLDALVASALKSVDATEIEALETRKRVAALWADYQLFLLYTNSLISSDPLPEQLRARSEAPLQSALANQQTALSRVDELEAELARTLQRQAQDAADQAWAVADMRNALNGARDEIRALIKQASDLALERAGVDDSRNAEKSRLEGMLLEAQWHWRDRTAQLEICEGKLEFVTSAMTAHAAREEELRRETAIAADEWETRVTALSLSGKMKDELIAEQKAAIVALDSRCIALETRFRSYERDAGFRLWRRLRRFAQWVTRRTSSQ